MPSIKVLLSALAIAIVSMLGLTGCNATTDQTPMAIPSIIPDELRSGESVFQYKDPWSSFDIDTIDLDGAPIALIDTVNYGERGEIARVIVFMPEADYVDVREYQGQEMEEATQAVLSPEQITAVECYLDETSLEPWFVPSGTDKDMMGYQGLYRKNLEINPTTCEDEFRHTENGKVYRRPSTDITLIT